MFAYNQLSDLKDGSLVTPLRKENGKVVCLLDGKETSFEFEDFDFDKQPGERVDIVAVGSEKDIKNKDDAIYIIEEGIECKSKNVSMGVSVVAGALEIIDPDNIFIDNSEYGFIQDETTKKEILSNFNVSYNDISKVKIYREKVEI